MKIKKKFSGFPEKRQDNIKQENQTDIKLLKNNIQSKATVKPHFQEI